MCSRTALWLLSGWQETLQDQRGRSSSSSGLPTLTDVTCGLSAVSLARFIYFCSPGEMLSCLRAVGRRLSNVLQSAAAFDSFSDTELRQQSQPVSLHYCDTHLSPIAPSKNRAIYHPRGQLTPHFFPPPLAATFSRSAPPPPDSAFLWKTAVILIDEIQRCPKQSLRSPTVAHRQGCCSVVIVPREERSASGECHAGGEKKSRFSAEKGQKTVSLQAVGKWRRSLSSRRRKQYPLGLFSHSLFPLFHA